MARTRTVTNYHVLTDNRPLQVRLGEPNASTESPFDPPDDMIMANSGKNKPILSYEVDADGGGLTRFTVFVGTENGDKIDSHNIGGDSRTYFEPFSASFLDGQTKFTWHLDEGVSLRISSVIVWFNRLIEV